MALVGEREQDDTRSTLLVLSYRRVIVITVLSRVVPL